MSKLGQLAKGVSYAGVKVGASLGANAAKKFANRTIDKVSGKLLGYQNNPEDAFSHDDGRKSRPEYRLPKDYSKYGKTYDDILRQLPPSMRLEFKRERDMELRGANQILGLGVKYLRYLVGVAKDYALGFVNKQVDKIFGVSNDDNPAKGLSSIVEPLTYYGNPTTNQQAKDIAKFKKHINNVRGTHLEWTKDTRYEESVSGISGYKVVMKPGCTYPDIVDPNPYSLRNDPTSDSPSQRDQLMSRYFRPREDTMWYIIIGKYTQADGAHYDSALPDLPTFVTDYSDDSNSTINYNKWIPATSYNYARRQVRLGSVNYGWSGSMDVVTSITRGNEFTITLLDDRDHNFSKYAKEVMNRSANYERASITYWECLIHKITLFIFNRQWEVIEKFTLLGILNSDGANSYSPDITGSLTWKFSIVGEIDTPGKRKLEELEYYNRNSPNKTNTTNKSKSSKKSKISNKISKRKRKSKSKK
jgi:hypothetical protein